MAKFTGGQAAAARAVVARRAELGFTQADLADVAVVSPRSIRNLEAGRHWPQPATRNKIERALGWPTGRLADIAEDRDRRPEVVNPYTGGEGELYEVLLGIDMPEADRHMLVSVYRMHRTGRGDETPAVS